MRGAASAATPAIAALVRAGVPHVVRSYAHDDAVSREIGYGAEAARALGVEPSRVFKTILAAVDADLVVAVLPVAQRLDLKALAAALGGKRASMADPREAERVTGYVVGGISPVGARRRLATVIDASALAHESVLVSAGRRGLDVQLAPADLAAITRAVVAPLAQGA